MRFRILFFIFMAAFNIATAQEEKSVDVLKFNLNNDGTLGSLKSDTTISYYEYGKMDANKYYNGYKKASTLTFLSSSCLFLASPIAGLSSAIATSSTTPKFKNLNIPDSSLTSNSEYMGG